MVAFGTGIFCILMGIFEKTGIMTIGKISFSKSLLLLILGLVLIAIGVGKSTNVKSMQTLKRIWRVVIGLALFLILLAILFIVFQPLFWKVFTPTKILTAASVDKYTIFVDLLLVFLALLGAMGYAIYKWIERGLESKFRETENLFRSRIFIDVSHIYWDQYEPEPHQELRQRDMHNRIVEELTQISQISPVPKLQRITHTTFSNRYLDHAIEHSKHALMLVETLDEENMKG